MGVALVIEVAAMNRDDAAADVTGFRVPSNTVANLESFSHLQFPRSNFGQSFLSGASDPMCNA